MKIITNADLEIAARTVWGEARGEPRAAREAVAWVIRNRVEAEFGQFKNDISAADACLRPWQFSCWNENDPNRVRLQEARWTDAGLLGCLAAVATAFSATKDNDPTQGAKHYHAEGINPGWAKGKVPSARIGRHVFYNTVE